jgi:predicted phage tail protein
MAHDAAQLEKLLRPLRGSGGGGGKFGGGDPPQNSEDTLRSEARVRLLDVISEGPIVGLANAEKSIFFDDVPLKNSDGTLNFEGVVWAARLGTPDQDWIPGFSSVESVAAITTQVTFSTPVTAVVSGGTYDAARVTIRFPALFETNDKGALRETAVEYQIEYKKTAAVTWTSAPGSPYTTVGKAMGGYEEDHYILLKQPGDPPYTGTWDVRVSRITVDSPDVTKTQNDTYFQALTSIVEARLIYPDTAYVGMEGSSTTFGGRVPVRTFEVKGLMVRVPSNYYPENLAFQNEVLRGNDLTNAYWVKSGGTAARAPSVSSPTGFANTLTRSGTGAMLATSGTVVNGGGHYTFSAWVKQGTATADALVRLKNTTTGNDRRWKHTWGSGTLVTVAGGTDTDMVVDGTSVTAEGTGWYRLTVTVHGSTGAVAGYQLVVGGASGAAAETVLVGGAVGGVGDYAEVFIDTAGSPVVGTAFASPRAYAGLWDGTWAVKWTDNPIWVLFDLLTNPRYGLGLSDDLVDTAGFYVISKYCDELVEDGFGSFEPRYTFNGQITTQQEAISLINRICATLQGMVYYASGGVFVAQDRPQSVRMVANNTNVEDGKFVYQTASSYERHNVALVSFTNKEDGDKPDVEVFELQSDVSNRGAHPANVEGFGIRSRGHAHRLGRWLLYGEFYEDEVVSFKAGPDFFDVMPGDVVEVHDVYRSAAVAMGRLALWPPDPVPPDNQVFLDRPVTLLSGHSYVLRSLDDDKAPVLRTVTTGAGAWETLLLSEGVGTSPNKVWALYDVTSDPSLFRVIARNMPDDKTCEITAVRHNPDKYALIETTVTLDPPDPPPHGGRVKPPVPTDIVAREYGWENKGGQDRVAVSITVDVPASPAVQKVEVQYRMGNNTNWRDAVMASKYTADLLDLPVDVLHFRGRTVSITGGRSDWLSDVLTLTGRVIAPDPPTDLQVDAGNWGAVVSWLDPDEPALKWVEVWRDTNSGFSGAVLVNTSTTQKFNDNTVQPGTTYFYWVRAVVYAETYVTSSLVGPESINGDDVVIVSDARDIKKIFNELGRELDRGGLLASVDVYLDRYFADTKKATEQKQLSVGITSNVDGLFASTALEMLILNDGQTALAAQMAIVQVRTDEATAGGLWKLEAVVGPNDVHARLAGYVKVTEKNEYAQAGMLLDVWIDKDDGTPHSRVAFEADKFVFTTATSVRAPFEVIGEDVFVNQLYIGEFLRSITYEEGVSGFSLNADGSAQFTDVKLVGGSGFGRAMYFDAPLFRNGIQIGEAEALWMAVDSPNVIPFIGGSGRVLWAFGYTRTPDYVILDPEGYAESGSDSVDPLGRTQYFISPGDLLPEEMHLTFPGSGQVVVFQDDGTYRWDVYSGPTVSNSFPGRGWWISQIEKDPTHLLGGSPVFGVLGVSRRPMPWIVPECSSLVVKCLGAGGGNDHSTGGRFGGPGAYVVGEIPVGPFGLVRPGDVIWVVIGEGGRTHTAGPTLGWGGGAHPDGDRPGGGGLTGIFRYTVTRENALLIAGGGGGSMDAAYGGPGGASSAGGNGVLGSNNARMQGVKWESVGGVLSAGGGGGYEGGGHLPDIGGSRAGGRGGMNYGHPFLLAFDEYNQGVDGSGQSISAAPHSQVTTDADYLDWNDCFDTDSPAGYGHTQSLVNGNSGGNGWVSIEMVP